MMTGDELIRVTDEWVVAARAAWPAIGLDASAFVAEVTTRLPPDAGPDAGRAIHAADLWLALACAAGDPVAIATFDERYVRPLDGVLFPTGLTRDQIEEVKQELRRKLLVPDGDRPRIADFSGRSDLRTWIRTIAIRAGIDLIRARRELPIEDEDELAALPAVADDPELAHLKDRYRDELRDAVYAAIAALPPRDRLLLKYHYVDGLSVDRIGAIYRVHRATAARWVAAAREALAAGTQRRLVDRLGVTPTQLRSIARLVESQLDVSMRRLLT